MTVVCVSTCLYFVVEYGKTTEVPVKCDPHASSFGVFHHFLFLLWLLHVSNPERLILCCAFQVVATFAQAISDHALTAMGGVKTESTQELTH